ncbi:MAG: M48 family metalloprotease [Proteobacteria bacterium]|nr:M48 family metalloprotease [Pseudomonadota bacterium]
MAVRASRSSDLSPNAFTYGHTPNNARIVLTAGMLKLLDGRRLKGVVGPSSATRATGTYC